MKRKNLTLLFLVYGFFVLSQKQNSKWYFGVNAGLDFLTNPPTILNNAASTSSSNFGCSVASDTSGALLFYTDGRTLFTKTHTVMANGTMLANNTNSNAPYYQGCLVVKQPGNANLYYVFNVGWGNSNGLGLYYSVVDMSLASGMGSVTVKNTPITTVQLCGQLTGVRHCNGTDVWILTHEYNSPNFRAYLLSSSGINTTAVVSAAGYQSAILSYMSVSPTGKKIATTWNNSFPTVFDFNPATAVVSNSMAVPTTPTYVVCTSLEFSPDGTKIYGGIVYNSQSHAIAQWNLCAGSTSAIAASIYTASASNINYSLKLGPDGKIYVARLGQNYIGVVNNPNASGSACNYINNGQYLASGSCRYMLAQYISTPPAPPSFAYNAVCTNVSFTTSPVAMTLSNSCAMTNHTLLAQTWDFGEPSSGSNNTSTSLYPTHNYATPGTYTVKLVLQYACYTDTIKKIISINGSHSFTLNGPSVICAGNQAIITASSSGANSYSWNTGATTSSISVSPAATTVYSVLCTSASNTCSSVKYFTLNVAASPSFAINGNDSICLGNTAVITASSSGAMTYSWNTGATAASISVSPNVTTVYTVLGTNPANNCSSVKSYTLHVISNPTFAVNGTGPICPGTLTVLTASSNWNLIYNWSTGQTGSGISVSPAVSTVYTVSGSQPGNQVCALIKTVQVMVYPVATLTVFANPAVICAGEQTTLNAVGALSYTWLAAGNPPVQNFGSMVVSPVNNITYSITGVLANTCKSQNTLNVQVNACTDINNLTFQNNDVRVYPSPGHGIFYIESTQATHCFVSDALGRIIEICQVDRGKGEGRIDDNSKGVYWVKVMSGNRVIAVKKLIVE